MGGAIVGNAGAWGHAISEAVISVNCLSPNGDVEEILTDDISFAYRRSSLQGDKRILLSAKLNLKSAQSEELKAEREKILAHRKEKHPNLQELPCAGSIFKNIEPTSRAERRQAAGHYLQEAGVKNFKFGDAAIYEKHANIIVNTGSATSKDISKLIDQMCGAVEEQFGIKLEREIKYLGAVTEKSPSNGGFH